MDDSRINELAAGTIIEDDGEVVNVIFPDNDLSLSTAECHAVYQKAQEMQKVTEFADTLISRLQSVTPPPPSEEEWDEELRKLEAEAREELQNDGCPPCYPSGFDIILQDVPEAYQAIVTYWKSQSGSKVALCAQSEDWKIFRRDQKRMRRKYGQQHFDKYLERVRERRQKHNLNGEVRFLWEPKQQDQVQTWMEFQNYHICGLEILENELGETMQHLIKGREKAAAGTGNNDFAVQNVTNLEVRLGVDHRYVEKHMVLLRWIEQIRKEMVTKQAEAAREDQNGKSEPVRRTSTRLKRTNRPAAPAVLGTIRVSKPKQKIRKTCTRTPRAFKLETVVQDSASMSRNSAPQSSGYAEPRATRIGKKQQPLSQPRPQRVSKTIKQVDSTTNAILHAQSRAKPRPARHQLPQMRRPASQQLQSSFKVVTRSGRISKPPVRFSN